MIKKSHRSKYFIPLEPNDPYSLFKTQGFRISYNYNPREDRNCQFAAIARHLQELGIFRSENTLKKKMFMELMNFL